MVHEMCSLVHQIKFRVNSVTRTDQHWNLSVCKGGGAFRPICSELGYYNERLIKCWPAWCKDNTLAQHVRGYWVMASAKLTLRIIMHKHNDLDLRHVKPSWTDVQVAKLAFSNIWPWSNDLVTWIWARYGQDILPYLNEVLCQLI